MGAKRVPATVKRVLDPPSINLDNPFNNRKTSEEFRAVLLCFIGLNPIGTLLFLWVLAIPAWVLGCPGLYHGMKTILLREPRRTLAILGAGICTLVVLLPLYPIVCQWYAHRP